MRFQTENRTVITMGTFIAVSWAWSLSVGWWNVLGVDGGDGCMATRIYWMPLNRTSEMVRFTLCGFYHNGKLRDKVGTEAHLFLFSLGTLPTCPRAPLDKFPHVSPKLCLFKATTISILGGHLWDSFPSLANIFASRSHAKISRGWLYVTLKRKRKYL